MKHNPPTAPLVYIAEPVDLARGQSHDGAVIARELADCGVTCYRPVTTWSGGQHNPALVEKINRDMLSRADAVVVIGTTGVPSIGTWMEVEQARTRDIPVIVRWHATTPKSVSLQAAGVLWADTNAEAVALASDFAVVRHRSRQQDTPDLMKVVLADGQTILGLPSRGYPDDGGVDLITSEATIIEPGAFGDVPTTVAGVQLPPWSWGMITGRSSTLRKRGLLVPTAVIDAGWRGPLFAGAFNLTAEPVKVEAGERIAQLIILDNATARVQIAAVNQLDPHDRGLRGFGSSGS